MGWLLPLAAGYGEATVARRERERADIAREEQIMLNTMLPIALQNRQQRQADRKKYKEQYNTLTDIVSADVAQSIMRKGDPFVQGFITKVGEIENEIGKSVKEADLIERGDITRQMESFPTGMKTVDVVPMEGKYPAKSTLVDPTPITERVRTAPSSVGYKQIGANFDTFMRELMGDFQNTDIDTNKVKEDVILGFGKIPGYEKAMTHSVHRKLAAQLGISPNEVGSLVSGEYDYTDITAEGYGVDSEDYKTTVKMPFAKGLEYYNIQNVKAETERGKLADSIRLPVTIDGEEKFLPIALASTVMTYQESAAKLKLFMKQRVVTADQENASQDMYRVMKVVNGQIAQELGGKFKQDSDGNYTFFFEGENSADVIKEIAFNASSRAQASYAAAVSRYGQGDIPFYIKEAGLDSASGIRHQILHAAKALTTKEIGGHIDPNKNGTYVRMLTTENYTPPKTNPYFTTVLGKLLPSSPQFTTTLRHIEEQGGFTTGTPVSTYSTLEEDPKKDWNDQYFDDFVLFTNMYSGLPYGKRPAVHALDFQNTIINELQLNLNKKFSLDDKNKIRKHLDFGGILNDEKMPLRRIEGVDKGQSKFEAMQEKIEGLPEFVKSLGVVETGGGDVETVGETEEQKAARIAKEEEAARLAAEEAARKEEQLIESGDGRKGYWDGRKKDGLPVGVGTIEFTGDAVGITALGEYNHEGKEVGPWRVNDPATGVKRIPFNRSDYELDRLSEDGSPYIAVNDFIRYTTKAIFQYGDGQGRSSEYEELENIEAKLQEVYTDYEKGRTTSKEFANKLKELGLVVNDVVGELWEDEGTFQKDGNKHNRYKKDLKEFTTSFQQENLDNYFESVSLGKN